MNWIKPILLTIKITLGSFTFGILVATLFSMVLLSRFKVLKALLKSFIYLVKGTPMVVQLFMIYYGLGQFEFFNTSIIGKLLSNPVFCIILSLGINSGAYMSGIIINAINNIPKPDIDAAKSLQIPRYHIFTKIIIPQIILKTRSSYLNEFIIILKSTSLASTIAIMELVGFANKIIALNYNTIEIFGVLALIYLSLNFVFSRILNLLLLRFETVSISKKSL